VWKALLSSWVARVVRGIPLNGLVHDHWQPLTHNDSLGKYARVVEKFFLVALRSLNGHPSAYDIPLSPAQKEAAGSLFEALSLPDTPEALYLFHRFSWSLLVRQEDNKEVTDWSCPFLCYFAVLALHPCGNLMSPDEYSGYGAKFKYFCNNVGIFEADLRADKHPQGMIG
jgi:hypothetical protein